MSLHPLAEQFGSVADAYERGRPEYRPAVVGAIAAELRLGPRARVLDLAAGTGKLTRALLACGLDVIAVEPQAALRERLEAVVSPESVHDGLAEAIPLPDASVDAVTVADAIHWFDHAAAIEEIRRVLRPGGGLAVLWTLPDWRGASWADALGSLMQDVRPEHPAFDGPRWQDAVHAAGGWAPVREIRVTTAHAANAEGIVDYLKSVSWVAAMDEDRRAETVARIEALVSGGETPPEMPIHVVVGLTSLDASP
jgi:SAM-dependent methyltransferase